MMTMAMLLAIVLIATVVMLIARGVGWIPDYECLLVFVAGVFCDLLWFKMCRFAYSAAINVAVVCLLITLWRL
jgi:hypothetical protein